MVFPFPNVRSLIADDMEDMDTDDEESIVESSPYR